MSTASNRNFGPPRCKELEFPIPFIKDPTELEACVYCGYHQKRHYNFCISCGRRKESLHKNEIQKRENFRTSLTALGLYGIYLLILVMLIYNSEDGFKEQRWLSYVDAVVTLGFVLSVKGLWKYLAPQGLETKALLGILAITLVSPFIVIKTSNWIADSFHLINYDYIFWDAPAPLAFTLVLVAVFPAIFEELTYRGFIYHHIQKISGPKAAILVSAVIFAMVHFSLVSIFWLLPFGLLLAYYRKKYNTLFYGILGHFTHNAGVVLAQYFEWY